MVFLYALQRRGTIMVHNLHSGMNKNLQQGRLKFEAQEEEFLFLLDQKLAHFDLHVAMPTNSNSHFFIEGDVYKGDFPLTNLAPIQVTRYILGNPKLGSMIMHLDVL